MQWYEWMSIGLGKFAPGDPFIPAMLELTLSISVFPDDGDQRTCSYSASALKKIDKLHMGVVFSFLFSVLIPEFISSALLVPIIPNFPLAVARSLFCLNTNFVAVHFPNFNRTRHTHTNVALWEGTATNTMHSFSWSTSCRLTQQFLVNMVVQKNPHTTSCLIFRSLLWKITQPHEPKLRTYSLHSCRFWTSRSSVSKMSQEFIIPDGIPWKTTTDSTDK